MLRFARVLFALLVFWLRIVRTSASSTDGEAPHPAASVGARLDGPVVGRSRSPCCRSRIRRASLHSAAVGRRKSGYGDAVANCEYDFSFLACRMSSLAALDFTGLLAFVLGGGDADIFIFDFGVDVDLDVLPSEIRGGDSASPFPYSCASCSTLTRFRRRLGGGEAISNVSRLIDLLRFTTGESCSSCFTMEGKSSLSLLAFRALRRSGTAVGPAPALILVFAFAIFTSQIALEARLPLSRSDFLAPCLR